MACPALPVGPQPSRLCRRDAPRGRAPIAAAASPAAHRAKACRASSIRTSASISGRALPRCALSPCRRLPREPGRLFSRPAMEACGDAPQPGQRLSGDRVQHVLDRPAADLVGPQRLEERGPLRVRQVPLVLGRRDPLADHLVDLRRHIFPPEGLKQLEQVRSVSREVLRRLDLLQSGPFRLVLLQRLGEHRLPRGQLQVAGPVRHPQRNLPRQVGTPCLAELRQPCAAAPWRRRPARPGSAEPGPAARSPRGRCSSPGRGSRRRRPGCGSAPPSTTR